MTSMFQILRIDDSIVRKLDLKVGINTIGNNLNPPLEGEIIIPQAAEINLLPTGEMLFSTCEGISCYFKSYHSRCWKQLETNKTIPLNPGDTCLLSPLKIWFRVLHQTSNINEKKTVKREIEEKLETEPPDKKCCLENTNYTEPLHSILAENERSLLVKACSVNDYEKSGKNKEFFQYANNLCVRNEEEKMNCFPEVSDNFDLPNTNERVPIVFQEFSVKPKNQKFKVKKDHYKKKKGKQTKKADSKCLQAKINHNISITNNNSNGISLMPDTSNTVLKKQKIKDQSCRKKVQFDKKENHYEESQGISLNKPSLSTNSQPKSKHKHTHKKSRQSKLFSDFSSTDNSPIFLSDDSNGFNSETSNSGEDECRESYFLIDDIYDRDRASQLKKL